jgi:hypothetical protein
MPRLIRYGLGLLRHLSPPGLRDRWVKEWEGELTHWWRRKSASHPAAHLHLLWRFQIAARDAIHLRTLGGSWNLSHPKSAIEGSLALLGDHPDPGPRDRRQRGDVRSP